ncbi:hypothetical protein KAT36_04540 [Candidatus Pacearchaeota archaeon]|nr:hypothetical protein [Candidatus Pacearchaeota archaeon]
MRSLLRLDKKKKGLSNLVAYVLLISITISLSVLVYGWLKFYVMEDEIATCPEGVNLIVSNYKCVSGVDGNLTLALKNKGLFSVGGYVLRVHDREDAEFGFYIFDNGGEVIAPGETVSKTYVFADYSEKVFDDLTLVEVQPYLEGDERISCESYAFQRIECH